MSEDENEVKKTIRFMLENMDVTLCKTLVDWESNLIRIEFSAKINGLFDANPIDGIIQDLFPPSIQKRTQELLTSDFSLGELRVLENGLSTKQKISKKRPIENTSNGSDAV
jgi:hypothetical protein